MRIRLFSRNLSKANKTNALPFRVMQPIRGFVGERDVDLNARTLPGRGVDVEQSIHQFGTPAHDQRIKRMRLNWLIVYALRISLAQLWG
jgi:hypothetical protein